MAAANQDGKGNMNQPPSLPSEEERKRLKDNLKIQMHLFEQNVLPFLELWSNRTYTTNEQAQHIHTKFETYALMKAMMQSYDNVSAGSGCATKP